MSRFLRFGLIGLWLLFATLFLTRWWIAHPDLFPPLPESLWDFLSTAYGVNCCESQADLEALVVLAVSFIAISFLTLLCKFLFSTGFRQLRGFRK